MSTPSIRPRAVLLAAASGLLWSLTALGLVACGSSSSSASSSSSSSGSGSTSSTATYAVLYSFGSVTGDGEEPTAGLIQGSDGNLYGTTYLGGVQSVGTVFRVSPTSGAETVLYSFGSVTGDGEEPTTALIQGSDGNLYGTAYYGGTQNRGAVFEISPTSGAETVLYSFGSVTGDGSYPAAALIQGSDGNLYGTTFGGGTDDDGTVFTVSPSSGTETVLHSFTDNPDGAEPGAPLMQSSDGNLYGTTIAGGNYNDGTIFVISPSSGTETVLYSFGAGVDDGQDPNESGLIQGSDGNFYGTTLQGGTYGEHIDNSGTVFMFSPSSGTETVLYSFGGFSGDGEEPTAGVIQGSDGNLYGTTFGGGSHSSGTVFRYSPSSATEAVLYSFGNFSGDGEDPLGSLIQLSNGTFYGTTSKGGTDGSGTVFDFTVN